jgi:hypothetical protein
MWLTGMRVGGINRVFMSYIRIDNDDDDNDDDDDNNNNNNNCGINNFKLAEPFLTTNQTL